LTAFRATFGRHPDRHRRREPEGASSIERDVTVDLLWLLIEVDRRGLHLALGHSSPSVYCTRVLRLSEQSAYRRITAARTARRFPRVIEFLSEGSLTLSSIGLLAPQLTPEIADSLIDAVRFKSTREVERLIAATFSQPDVPTEIRACPRPQPEMASSVGGLFPRLIESPDAPQGTLPAGPPLAVTPPAGNLPKTRTVVAPVSLRRYFLKVTISNDTHDTLDRARALLRHAVPDGDVDAILNRALSLLLDQVLHARTGAGRRARQSREPGPSGRSIPAAVRREVWRRDGGRCAFSGPDGPCGETAFLEYHHVIPFAAGGPSKASNLQLRCRAHNAYEARVYFGHRYLNSARAE
jgi:hypothetical protein